MVEESENQYGENLSDKELTDFAKRIRKLSDEKIDELYYLCEFIVTDHDSNRKALRNDEDLGYIRASLKLAKEKIWYLIAETKRSDFLKNLEKVENSE